VKLSFYGAGKEEGEKKEIDEYLLIRFIPGIIQG
jgi:hypothetical protein